MPIDRSTLGPVEVMAVRFHGDKFRGEIISALQQLIDDEVINVLDLGFVRKAPDGTVTTLKAGMLEDTEIGSYAELVEAGQRVITDAELADAAEALEPGNAAGILVWEDRWAIRFVDAIRAADGELLSLERVPNEAVDELLDSLQAD